MCSVLLIWQYTVKGFHFELYTIGSDLLFCVEIDTNREAENVLEIFHVD